MAAPGILGKRRKNESALHPTTDCQSRKGPSIVLNGEQTVVLRRFDKGAGMWEVESAGGAVSLVPMSSLDLDLGLPPPQPGASLIEPWPGASLIEPILVKSDLSISYARRALRTGPEMGARRRHGGCVLPSGPVGNAGFDSEGHVRHAPHRGGVSARPLVERHAVSSSGTGSPFRRWNIACSV